MKIKTESFFSKYNLTPDKSAAELRMLFQTDPEKRKDLPIVLKLISSNESLLEEELYTIHSSDEEFWKCHRGLLTICKELSLKVTRANVHLFYESFAIFCAFQDDWNRFFYFETVGSEKAIQIVKSFTKAIYDSIAEGFVSSLGELSEETVDELYGCLSSAGHSFSWLYDNFQDFEDALCNFAENSLAFDHYTKEIDSAFKTILSLEDKVEQPYFKSSIRFAFDKMMKDSSEYLPFLLENYGRLLDIYSGNTGAIRLANLLEKTVLGEIDMECKKDVLAINVHNNAVKIKDAYAVFSSKVNLSELTDKDFDRNNFEVSKKLVEFVEAAGADWVSTYRQLFKQVHSNTTMQNMYDLIKHIIDKKPYKSVQNLLGLIIMANTDFHLLLTYILSSHQEATSGIADKYIDPKDIDDFIGKFFWIILMLEKNDNFPSDFFDKIQMCAFDFMAGQRQDNAFLALMQARAMFTRIPKDFFIDETTRVVDYVRKLEGIEPGPVSESSKYIDMYTALFGVSDSKRGRRAYEKRSSYPSSSYRSTTNSSSYSSSSSSSSSSGCYIATCVYGSYNCPEVWRLRRYRDYYLDNHWWGRAFIKMYYAISPSLVKTFGNRVWFRNLWNKFLNNKIEKLISMGYSDQPYEDKY